MRILALLVVLPLLVAACVSAGAQPTQVQTEVLNTTLPVNVTPAPTSVISPTDLLPQERTQIPVENLTLNKLDLQTQGLLPEFEADIQINKNLTHYSIDVIVEFDPNNEIAILSGETHIRYFNIEDVPLHDLVLMLWPNDDQYLAEMEAGPVIIHDQIIDHQIELDGLAMRVSLPEALLPGEALELSLPFSLRTQGSISNQRKRFGITNGVLMAPTFYPLIPRFVEGEWQVDIAPYGGDTTNSDSAYFEVSITASDEFEVIASGVEIDRKHLQNNQQVVTFVTGPMRDFAFALGNLEKRSKSVNGVSLNAWILPWHLRFGEQMLNVAAQQMEILNNLVGPYPYVEMDIVDTPCSFGGIEYPGLVYICSVDDGYFIDTTVHEIAHQWFYGLIGNDQLYEPWLDESLASYWQVLYYENTAGEERAEIQLQQFRNWVDRPEDQAAPIGRGIEDYRLIGDYYSIVYFKGALFFDALRSELGDELFFDFLRTYYQRYRYDFVSTQNFHELVKEVCDCDLEDLFNLWVYEGGEVFE